ncbi:putative toxin-antitoxin system, antitoxin component [delta proteobacterium NaphS2]|nr:putative toxin-antitoxin system, antitoxin component [delta proteobacterium NaphS2]
MKDIDVEKVGTLVSSIQEAMSRLREVKALSKTEFLEDRHKQDSAKYNFIVAIEAAIDIANHLISRKGFRAPEDYADTFRVLKEAGILETDFSMELEKMARFRNRLVHLYWKVDTVEVWKILQTRLGDFEQYLSSLGSYLNK